MNTFYGGFMGILLEPRLCNPVCQHQNHNNNNNNNKNNDLNNNNNNNNDNNICSSLLLLLSPGAAAGRAVPALSPLEPPFVSSYHCSNGYHNNMYH